VTFLEIRVSFKTGIILVLLLAEVVMNALSIFFFIRLDRVVHGDLYRYGLRFDPEWTTQYWTYSRFMMSFLAVAMLVTGISIVFTLIHARTRGANSRLITYVLLALGVVTTGFSAFFLNRLNYIVHSDLYNYGLRYDTRWVIPYWNFLYLTLGLMGLAIATTAVSIGLIFLGARGLVKIDLTKLVCSILLSAGVIALAFSISSTSSILAFIGLGLVFWGAILFYVRPEKYVKETMFVKTTLPSLVNLEQMLTELGYQGKGVYLPPKYFRDFESSKIYLSAQDSMKLPSLEQIRDREDKAFLKNSGVLITPPGMELLRSFEKTLGTSFMRVDLQYLEQNMPKLLIEDLEIAQKVEIKNENSRVYVRMESAIFKNLWKEAIKLSNVWCSLGDPLVSAIACALTRATGKPVIIEKNQISNEGQTIDIAYRILEERKEKTH
jgi:hypothetical protein